MWCLVGGIGIITSPSPATRRRAVINLIPYVSRHALSSTRRLVWATAFRDGVITALVISIRSASAIMANGFCTVATNFTSSALKASNVDSSPRFSLRCGWLIRCEFDAGFLASRLSRLWGVHLGDFCEVIGPEIRIARVL